MKLVEWSMQGVEFVNCNCAYGCPCQFQGLPTHGDCCAYCFVQIEKGRFGDVPLDGLRWGILAKWPGAIHEGNGTLQTIVDERADVKQRAAIEAVSHGRETEPGRLIWQVFSTTMTTFLPTLYKPIDLIIDLKTRKARVEVPGVVEGDGTSIRNEMAGTDVQTRITMPAGFEFHEAEFISGKGKTANGGIHLDFDGTHAHLARVHWTTHGVVH
ncbi:MAG: DUF1326 domain-containing protein [Opitutaceae bacterium]